MEPKKYGLIRLPKSDSSKPQTKITKNIFDSDSDDESFNPPNKVSTSSGIKRQTQLDISRALTDDPTVFEYDSIYEEMKSQKQSIEDKKSESKEKPKPKYINSLLKYAETRKKEMERRTERKIQKEREAEGNEFEDKEQFVTNAYKEKLEEMRAADERDLKEQAIEELLDVKKQQDLSGFYRNLLNREIERDVPSKASDDKTSDVTEELQKVKTSFPKSKTNRQIRERRSSSESESEDISPPIEEKTVETERKSRRNSPLKESSVQKESKRKRKVSENENKNQNKSDDKNDKNRVTKPSKLVKTETEKNENVENINKSDTNVNEEINVPKKLDKRELLLKIFTKRTVDQVFSDAQMRYYQRRDNYVI